MKAIRYSSITTHKKMKFIATVPEIHSQNLGADNGDEKFIATVPEIHSQNLGADNGDDYH